MNCSVNIPSSVIAVLIAVDGDLDFTAFKKVVKATESSMSEISQATGTPTY